MTELEGIRGWPALAGARNAKACCERGVWGKAHGARSDFRWLATSSGFGRDRPRLGRQLNLGLEDRPQNVACWRFFDGVYYAVGTYPSRASDAARRRGFLEKQVLEWRPEGDVPAAAAASILLAEVVSFDDSAWWSRRDEAAWSDPGFALAIDGLSRELSEQRLFEEAAAGLRELREGAVGEDELAELYAGFLGGLRPAGLVGLEAPLPPRALAALLLPLPRPTVDRLSVAGWLPSSRGELEDLGRRWDVVVCPPGFRQGTAIAQVDGVLRETARTLARTLLDGDPGPLKNLEIVPEPAAGVKRPSDGRHPEDLTWEEWTAAMYRDLERTTARLIELGLWESWRRHARLRPRERFNTAMAWMTSAVWSRPGVPVPSLETWEEVLDDVGTLDRKRMKQLCAGPQGAHTWPWIPRHEAEQLADLGEMATDPEAAELLARSIEPESGCPAEGCPAEGCPAEGCPAEGCPAEGLSGKGPA